MRALQMTMLVIALFALTVQTVRHGYHRWIEPRGSVLDSYAGRKKEIQKAPSLEELLKQYDEAYKKVKAYEADKSNPKIEWRDKEDTEPYQSERQLKVAIEGWEKHSREIFELHFFWLCGLAIVLMGIVVYRYLTTWSGFTLLMAGFSEMIYWSSPNFLSTPGVEFDRMLTQKFVFSLATLVLLILAGYMTGVITIDNPKHNSKTT